jgi:hypothetical protein
MALMYPRDSHAANDNLGRYDVGNVANVMYWPLQLPASGTVQPPGWLHAHRARQAGYVLVAGKHTLRSLTGLPGAHLRTPRPAPHIRTRYARLYTTYTT